MKIFNTFELLRWFETHLTIVVYIFFVFLLIISKHGIKHICCFGDAIKKAYDRGAIVKHNKYEEFYDYFQYLLHSFVWL